MALRAGQAPAAATVDALTRALAHRGPDGAGHHVAGSVALAHTRLAIIDLATGDQPLFAGAAALVGNGEVYNYRELRDEHGLHCATGSDCEPPLHLWRRDGTAFADRVRGMYAIALHDPRGAAGGRWPRPLRHQAALHWRVRGRPSPSPPSRRR
jgi:asparagine synthase (glutamine-hydrolysing)